MAIRPCSSCGVSFDHNWSTAAEHGHRCPHCGTVNLPEGGRRATCSDDRRAERVLKAMGVWTVLMVVLVVGLWVVGSDEVLEMGPGGMGAGILLVLALFGTVLVWLVGVVALVVAALLGAFSRGGRTDIDASPPTSSPPSH